MFPPAGGYILKQKKTAHKEKIVEGKKPVHVPKQNWVPVKDIPSGIGSSLGFAASQKEVVPVPTVVDHQVPTPQQAVTDIPIQQDVTVTLADSTHDINNNNIPEEYITEAQLQSNIQVEENNVTQ